MGKKNKKWKPLTLTEEYAPPQEYMMEEEEMQIMLKGAHEVIEKTVSKLYSSSNLEDHPFFFIHVNAYVLAGTKAFYPCEMALARFSLRKGIEETYHALVNPGSLPVGFAHDAQSYSEVTHRIPYPPLKHAESYLPRILDQVQQFVWGGPEAVEERRRYGQFAEEDLCLPPMYTFYDKELFHYDFVNEAVVFDLMQKLTTSSDEACRFVIHPLSKLMFELWNARALHEGTAAAWTHVQQAQDALQKDSFLYTPMLGCQFHEKIDAPACCSLSLVKRWALTVSSLWRPPPPPAGAVGDPGEAAASGQQGPPSASLQAVPSRRKLPSRTMPKLRQPYVSIQDKKPSQ